jgi:hypothetical protein
MHSLIYANYHEKQSGVTSVEHSVLSQSIWCDLFIKIYPYITLLFLAPSIENGS